MTRKDYVILANALKESKPSADEQHKNWFQQWNSDVNSIADCLAAENEAFDRESFLRACHGESKRLTKKERRNAEREENQ